MTGGMGLRCVSTRPLFTFYSNKYPTLEFTFQSKNKNQESRIKNQRVSSGNLDISGNGTSSPILWLPTLPDTFESVKTSIPPLQSHS